MTQNHLYKPYTNKEYATFVVKNQGKKLCEDNEKIWFEEYPITEPTYQELRMAEYPNLGEQLDMIYWDKINNTNNWQTKITEIKTKHPKP